MQKKTVFDFRDYKAYLKYFMAGLPGKGHGFRAELAKALRIHNAYVTQVFNGSAHFSAEQAEDINDKLGHGEDESQYFLLLVQLARSGTPRLTKRIQAQLDQILQKRIDIKKRVGIRTTLTLEDQLTYYSTWHFAAIHIALTIPRLQYLDQLSAALGLPQQKVRKVLEFLVNIGLAEQSGSRFLPRTSEMFLGRTDINILKHHINWRMKAIDSLDRDTKENLHFTAAVSLSHEDYARIREDLAQKIQDSIAQIKKSKEEVLCAFSIDFFRVEK